MSATAGPPDLKVSAVECAAFGPITGVPANTLSISANLGDHDTVLLAFLTIAVIPVKACNDFAIHDLGWNLYVRLSTYKLCL